LSWHASISSAILLICSQKSTVFQFFSKSLND
jgi:hypothetical protein